MRDGIHTTSTRGACGEDFQGQRLMLLLANNADCPLIPLLIQSSMSHGSCGCSVVVVTPSRLSRLPPPVRDMPAPHTSNMSTVKFRYAEDRVQLQRYLASIHCHPISDRPTHYVITDLQHYITHPPLQDAISQTVATAKLLALLADTALYTAAHNNDDKENTLNNKNSSNVNKDDNHNTKQSVSSSSAVPYLTPSKPIDSAYRYITRGEVTPKNRSNQKVCSVNDSFDCDHSVNRGPLNSIQGEEEEEDDGSDYESDLDIETYQTNLDRTGHEYPIRGDGDAGRDYGHGTDGDDCTDTLGITGGNCTTNNAARNASYSGVCDPERLDVTRTPTGVNRQTNAASGPHTSICDSASCTGSVVVGWSPEPGILSKGGDVQFTAEHMAYTVWHVRKLVSSDPRLRSTKRSYEAVRSVDVLTESSGVDNNGTAVAQYKDSIQFSVGPESIWLET